ncbi:hypothetical protein [Lacticaseibacillus porcinae]|uniref:hypothetical protein n=1 Tax=Lacticaseibacillus porcinae TaxID=1123687 RepID=UPI000F79BC48|nr:hypothetical protein [Lacticaseibacillus porcinae]
MRRSRRRRRHLGLWFFILIIIAIALTTLFLIFRGAKVSGPDSQNSSSVTKVIDTTPTASSTKTTSGTWTASGKAEDPDGERLKVQVYLTLKTNGHYRRELVIQGDSVRTIVDSGTYSGSKTFKLKSQNAVIFTYTSKKAQRNQVPKATTQYDSDYASYPSYLKTVLNNRVSKTTYRYVDTKLSLSTTNDSVPTIAKAMDAQSTTTRAADSSTTDDNDTANADTTADEQDTKTNDSTNSNADSNSDTTSDSSSSSSKMTVSQAQAIVEQQYPSSDYTITAMGQTGTNFTFVVINQKTRDNQYVTVNADGEIQ